MGRAPCCDKANVKRGPWSPEEDAALRSYIEGNGTGGNWISLPQKAGLKRCGKSCRLRWLNYLRPDIKHGGFTAEEDKVIYSLYKSIGSRWSVIASHLPGRTDNDVKNYWNTKLMKKILAAGETISPVANNPITFNKFHHPSPSPPPKAHLPAIKDEAFFSDILPLATPLNSSSSRSSLAFQYQPPADFSLTGYSFSPPADELSVSASAGSSSLTIEDGGSGGISYSNWNPDGAYFEDAAFLPELGYSSWSDLLESLMSSGGPESLYPFWANADASAQGVHQSLPG